MRRFWHYLLTSWPMLFVAAFISLHKVHFARVSRHEKVLALFVTSWPMLSVATFISLHKVHFARVSRHEKVLALFVTSWPMLFIAAFISLHKVHFARVSGMRRFWHYLLPHGRCYSLPHLFYYIKYILLEFPGMRRF